MHAYAYFVFHVSKKHIIHHHVFQVVGILVGLGIIALVTSPLLLVASPCIICCICKSYRSKKKKHSPPTT